MVGLNAFDENGIDITADAIRGFQSLQSLDPGPDPDPDPTPDPNGNTVVPEPGTVSLLGGGLALLVVTARRRRRMRNTGGVAAASAT